ncbi:MAG: S4 domain-containing protein [Aminobacterium sp.]|uniref:S4 domain-containing protein n=1 Tax=unclassified Aminobacterium TaxID=2685012 RepID=UPI001BCF77ED|nr:MULTISPECIES: S4 domain-containing protein [unclassified Aminobacterium]MDD2207169.1 S4 domain-containing protein [Aminobacterium sp.]MDD3425957.1 S4 domain-containing protein [Aminobacterium sp.]MDD3707131.1 S4 domain-containing protein [Aminobacterium sp.]MDD4228710.1 S4 domain-containing protein [Aminobacterium sp.]MDD4551725.1 S4 domain-containing protein [Aminobacterium sp.]
MRLDKYLKESRLVKRRVVAQEMVEVGAVRLNGRQCRSSAQVRMGDTVEIAYPTRVLTIKVLIDDEKMIRRKESIPYELQEERRVKSDEKPW